MIPKLEKLVAGWFIVPLKSGLFFWVGGGIAYLWHIGGWASFSKTFSAMKPEIPNMAIVLLFVILFLIMAVASSLLKYIDDFVLKFLEGYYWPSWLLLWWIHKQSRRWQEKERLFQTLANKTHQNAHLLTRKERDEYVALDKELMYLPESGHRLPTRLGNILRGHEQRPREKYGLDAFVCWPRLWLTLPGDVKQELAQARSNLDTGIHIWIWSILFIVWGIWAWWAILLSLMFTLLSYRWILQTAKVYGQLVEASFDTYRFKLYELLRWPLPTNPNNEHEQGRLLTEYLWRGSDSSKPEFKSSS